MVIRKDPFGLYEILFEFYKQTHNNSAESCSVRTAGPCAQRLFIPGSFLSEYFLWRAIHAFNFQ